MPIAFSPHSMNPKEKLSNDWKWQIAHRITTQGQLEKWIKLSPQELAAFDGGTPLPFAVTPYYAALLKNTALRRTVVPIGAERLTTHGELADPLGEEHHRATEHLIHTYPDKVLFIATTHCSSHCRYCTRSRLVGKSQTNNSSFTKSFQYLEAHTEIHDVLISGGDPLTLSDSTLDTLLSNLRKIPHIRTIRIGSKVPAVLPMRITPELCTILRHHHVWLSLHFIHPAELTTETRTACRKLSDHGLAMVSQTVLLKGINDNTQTLTDLFYGLLETNVKPYYLLQCDPVRGSAHFRTSVKKGIELIRSLQGRISGLAIPQYVIDAPGGGGKVPILGTEQIQRESNEIVIINYEGKPFRYPDLETT